jgi:hypothetical protein
MRNILTQWNALLYYITMPRKQKIVRRARLAKLPWLSIGIALILLIIGVALGNVLQQKIVPPTSQLEIGFASGKQTAQYLAIQTAASGTFTSANSEQGLWLLSLTNVAPRVLLLADRPRREVGSTNLEIFLHKVWNNVSSNSFSTRPPHAVLMIHDTNEEHEEAVVISLLKPEYDQDTGTLIYKTKILGRADPNTLDVMKDKDVTNFPENFDSPVLFIDAINFSGGF